MEFARSPLALDKGSGRRQGTCALLPTGKLCLWLVLLDTVHGNGLARAEGT